MKQYYDENIPCCSHKLLENTVHLTKDAIDWVRLHTKIFAWCPSFRSLRLASLQPCIPWAHIILREFGGFLMWSPPTVRMVKSKLPGHARKT